jgi:hypothetical protein
VGSLLKTLSLYQLTQHIPNTGQRVTTCKNTNKTVHV